MDEIPKGSEPFEGDIRRLFEDSSGVRMRLPGQASGKPNVLLVMLDDVGFGSCETFGGVIPSPGVDRIASDGLVFNQFHTTALCSPTRASLLAGRNHHSVHMGGTVSYTHLTLPTIYSV